METIIRSVENIDQTDRSTLERLIGHGLDEHQRVIIQILDMVAKPARANTNGTTVSDLPDWCNIYEGLTPEEVEDIAASIVRSPLSRSHVTQ